LLTSKVSHVKGLQAPKLGAKYPARAKLQWLSEHVHRLPKRGILFQAEPVLGIDSCGSKASTTLLVPIHHTTAWKFKLIHQAGAKLNSFIIIIFIGAGKILPGLPQRPSQRGSSCRPALNTPMAQWDFPQRTTNGTTIGIVAPSLVPSWTYTS
jgi:hypothetical protein